MKKVLITGSSTGIGFACANYFSKQNYHVFAHYFEENANISLLNKFKLTECLYSDFTDQDSFNNFLSIVKTKKIDILINNAGMFDFSNKSKNRIYAIEKVFRVNIISPVLLAEVIIKGMIQRNSGHIINISSIGAKYGSNMDNIFYGISKRGVESATKTLARIGAKNNVLVNSIRPGVTNTDFYNNLGKDIKKRIELIPLKRAMEPIELAKFIFFLSTENKFITNEIITIAGGE